MFLHGVNQFQSLKENQCFVSLFATLYTAIITTQWQQAQISVLHV